MAGNQSCTKLCEKGVRGGAHPAEGLKHHNTQGTGTKLRRKAGLHRGVGGQRRPRVMGYCQGNNTLLGEFSGNFARLDFKKTPKIACLLLSALTFFPDLKELQLEKGHATVCTTKRGKNTKMSIKVLNAIFLSEFL